MSMITIITLLLGFHTIHKLVLKYSNVAVLPFLNYHLWTFLLNLTPDMRPSDNYMQLQTNYYQLFLVDCPTQLYLHFGLLCLWTRWRKCQQKKLFRNSRKCTNKIPNRNKYSRYIHALYILICHGCYGHCPLDSGDVNMSDWCKI